MMYPPQPMYNNPQMMYPPQQMYNYQQQQLATPGNNNLNNNSQMNYNQNIPQQMNNPSINTTPFMNNPQNIGKPLNNPQNMNLAYSQSGNIPNQNIQPNDLGGSCPNPVCPNK